jgi:hypothetical protein
MIEQVYNRFASLGSFLLLQELHVVHTFGQFLFTIWRYTISIRFNRNLADSAATVQALKNCDGNVNGSFAAHIIMLVAKLAPPRKSEHTEPDTAKKRF